MEISITLSKKNAELFFKHIVIGNWVIGSNKDERDNDLELLYSQILSIMKNYNIINEIEFDEELNDYFLLEEKEEEYIEEIDNFCDNYFWDELINLLAKRDIFENYSEEELESLGDKKVIELILKKEEIYDKEFVKNGLKNLRIDKNAT